MFFVNLLITKPKFLLLGIFWGIQVSLGKKECPDTRSEVCKPWLPKVGVNNRIFHLLDDLREGCLLFSNLASHWPIYSLRWSNIPRGCVTCAVHHCGWFLDSVAHMPQWDIGVLNEHFFFSSIFRDLFLLPTLLAIIFASVYIKPFTTVKSLPTRQFDFSSFFLARTR